MEYSRQEYWVTIPFSRGIFLTPGLNSGLAHCRQTLYQDMASLVREPITLCLSLLIHSLANPPLCSEIYAYDTKEDLASS